MYRKDSIDIIEEEVIERKNLRSEHNNDLNR